MYATLRDEEIEVKLLLNLRNSRGKIFGFLYK